MQDEFDQAGGDRRSEGRFVLEVPVSVRKRGSHQLPGTLYDLSGGGCRVGGAYLAPDGESDVFVRIPGLESLACRVCWTDDGKSGLMFERRLHPAVFQRMVSLHGHGAAPVPVEAYSQLAPAPDYHANPLRPRPAGSRRDQIMAGYVMSDPGLLLDKQPAEGGKSIFTLVRRNTARNSDHRHEPRYPAPAEAAVSVGPADRPAEIANISGSGIMASGELGQEIGDSLEVRFAGCEPIWGTVIWKRGVQFGLSLPSDSIGLEQVA